MSLRLNFCRSVPPEFLRSFLIQYLTKKRDGVQEGKTDSRDASASKNYFGGNDLMYEGKERVH